MEARARATAYKLNPDLLDWQVPPYKIAEAVDKVPITPEQFTEILDRAGNDYQVDWVVTEYPRQAFITTDEGEFFASVATIHDNWEYVRLERARRLVPA